MDFTQEQITQILTDFSAKKNDGFQAILKIALEALMRSEREEFNLTSGDVSNGYRNRQVVNGHKKCVKSKHSLGIFSSI